MFSGDPLDPYAIEKIKDHYNPVDYKLTESFRCPQEIISTIKHIVPDMTSNKTGGEIEIVDGNRDIDFPDECFIISRTNNNLVKLAYKFIQENNVVSSLACSQPRRQLTVTGTTATVPTVVTTK